MPKSIIVYGPPGCGKSTNAERIRRHYGLHAIHDDLGMIGNEFHRVQSDGVLYLTCNPKYLTHSLTKTYKDVMAAIGGKGVSA